jgi:formamidopyrimidine-DNA glycosylase
MPELPEIEAYLGALRPRVEGHVLEGIRVESISLLKTADPPLSTAAGRHVTSLGRLGKRLVFGLEGELYLVLHLMLAGRLHWRARAAKIPRKVGQAAFDFDDGTLLLTEAGTKRRAALHLLSGKAALAALDPGGIELADASFDAFAQALRSERHTLKRSLTDARLFSGIGGAFADEILHRARLSPVQLTTNLDDAEVERLRLAAQAILAEWTALRIAETGDGFPEHVSAFHPRMAVHGKFGQPCPVCGVKIHRIVYAERETNYCPGCQTDGRILADRALSRLLKGDYPRRIEDLEG